MELKAVHHVGLVVRDLDRSIYFYHDLLGLPFANEPTPWFEGPALERGVGVPGARLRQVSLWVGENSTLELIEYANRPPTSIIHPVITLDCSDWSAGIPEEKITRGRFLFRSVVVPPVSPKRSKRKP